MVMTMQKILCNHQHDFFLNLCNLTAKKTEDAVACEREKKKKKLISGCSGTHFPLQSCDPPNAN